MAIYGGLPSLGEGFAAGTMGHTLGLSKHTPNRSRGTTSNQRRAASVGLKDQRGNRFKKRILTPPLDSTSTRRSDDREGGGQTEGWPLVDSNSLFNLEGELDNWPLRTRQSDPAGARPVLCRELEEFLNQEWSLVADDDIFGRVRISRQAFTMFIERFEVYSGVLHGIMKDYDAAVGLAERLKDQMSGMDTKLRMADIANQDKVRTFIDQTVREKREVLAESAEFRDKAEQLQQAVHSYQIMLATREAEVEELQQQKRVLERELTQAEREVGQYFDKADELRARVESQNEQLRRYEEERNHEMKHLQEANRAMAQDIMSMKINLDAVGDTKAVALVHTTKELEDERNKYAVATSAIKNLKSMVTKLGSEKKRLEGLLDRHDNWTPRPDYTDIEEQTDHKVRYTEGKSTASMVRDCVSAVRILQQHNTEQHAKLKDCVSLMHFLDKEDLVHEESGEGDIIHFEPTNIRLPKFMRVAGEVRNMRLTKRQTEQSLTEIWAAKRTADDPKGVISPLTHSFHLWLQKKFGLENLCVDYAYNLYHACVKFNWDADCEMFLRVLLGDVSAEVKDAQDAMVSNLHQLFCDLDPKGRQFLARKTVTEALRSFFPNKHRRDLVLLKNALYQEQPGTRVQYNKLFESDREGNQGKFMEELRDQQLHEILAYAAKIAELVEHCSDEAGMVNPSTFKQAFRDLDPAKPEEEINYVIHIGLGGKQLPKFRRRRDEEEPVVVEGEKVRRRKLVNDPYGNRLTEALKTMRGKDNEGTEKEEEDDHGSSGENPRLQHRPSGTIRSSSVLLEPSGGSSGSETSTPTPDVPASENSIPEEAEEISQATIANPTNMGDFTGYNPPTDLHDKERFIANLRRVLVVSSCYVVPASTRRLSVVGENDADEEDLTGNVPGLLAAAAAAVDRRKEINNQILAEAARREQLIVGDTSLPTTGTSPHPPPHGGLHRSGTTTSLSTHHEPQTTVSRSQVHHDEDNKHTNPASPSGTRQALAKAVRRAGLVNRTRNKKKRSKRTAPGVENHPQVIIGITTDDEDSSEAEVPNVPSTPQSQHTLAPPKDTTPPAPSAPSLLTSPPHDTPSQLSA